MLPRLNQTITKYGTQTVDAYGTVTASDTSTFQGRLTEGQSSDYSARGKEAQYDASLHLNATPELKEGDVLEYESTRYTVKHVTRTRDLNGDVLFQFCELVKGSGVKI